MLLCSGTEPGVLPGVLQRMPVPATAGVHPEPGLERPQVQATAVLPHAKEHGGRRTRHTAIQVRLYLERILLDFED